MAFESISYNVVRIGNVSFHISKTKIDGKIKYRTTRIVKGGK
jgi:hypothetical protein